MASFDFLLVLSVIALFGSLALQSRFLQIRARQFVSERAFNYASFPRIRPVNTPAKRPRRPIRWISFDEFCALLYEEPLDLLVLDLRADAQHSPFPVPAACVLPVHPDELREILDWLPSGQSVVFYGIRGPWIPTIEKSPAMGGSAPFYFLDCGLGHLEAA